ncbi:MAG: DUF2752 domain-containing protein [Bacteroidales bacterium]|jgi:hypothetical protein|nr:DUF2752 domain-containing protein [Bacteroidales bacterium]
MNDSAHTKNKKAARRFYALIGGMSILVIVLLCLPADFFDSGQSVCVSVLLFDRECYACGMTRAIQHLIHFEFQQTYEYNKLAFIVFPLFGIAILYELKKLYEKMKD